MADATSGRAPTSATTDRFDRAAGGKFEGRRAELADAALVTLGDLGFARTSLREIAQNSEFSHGVLHYYFRDKAELITFCVRRYKARCVTRYDELIDEAPSAEALIKGFAEALVGTLVDEPAMHRLWYDLRVQAQFDRDLLATVRDLDGQLERMILRVISRFAELGSRQLVLTPTGTYAAFDGLFEGALHRHAAGDADTLTRLRDEAVTLAYVLTTEESS